MLSNNELAKHCVTLSRVLISLHWLIKADLFVVKDLLSQEWHGPAGVSSEHPYG